MFIQPRRSFVALASAANAAANDLRYKMNNDRTEPYAASMQVPNAIAALLAAVDALTTAICDAEA